MMNNRLAKKANGLFLIVVLLSILANIFVSLLDVKGISLNIVLNLLISQMIIVVPGLIFYLSISKDGSPFKMYKRISSLSVFLLLIFTWLIMPLVTAANVFSQIFTRNEVMSISGAVLDLPVIPMVLIMGIIGPFCEEFVFRGIINNCLLRQSGRFIASGVVSGLFFGLMHMNLNQFCYAFILGIIFAIINDALDSTWPSFICHAIVNTQNVLLLFIADRIMKKASGSSLFDAYNSMAGNNDVATHAGNIAFIIMFVGLMVIALITTSLAGLLFYGICAIEGKEERFKNIFGKKEKNEDTKVLYPMGIAAISFCIFVMFLLEPIINLMK